MSKKILLYVSVLVLLCGVVASCVGNTANEYTYYTTSTSGALVRSFSLQADAKVLANLDSVYFTIDPERGIIYNADSLPYGTDVSHLLVTLSFNGTVGGAAFICTGSDVHRDTTLNYKTSMNDSIDFTGRVVLAVSSYDGAFVKNYDVMVNVHQVQPDTIVWSDEYEMPFGATASKTVAVNKRYMTLQRTAGGYTLASHDLTSAEWTARESEYAFTPVIESFTAAGDNLYVLADDGQLYTSPAADAPAWTATGETWTAIIGNYGARVLGIARDEDGYKHVEYPAPDGFESTAIESGFPIAGFSQLVAADNEWTVADQSLMAGGTLADGSCTANVWGYDGTRWGLLSNELSDARLSQVSGMLIFPFVTYTVDAKTFVQSEHITWLAMGGRYQNGTACSMAYASGDQGITWTATGTTLQLPEAYRDLTGAQAFVVNETYTAAGRLTAPRRVSTVVTSWTAKVVYVIGGTMADGSHNRRVLRGVLRRATYQPVY